MSQVQSSIYIEAPVEEVFGYVADYRHSKEYLVGFTRFEPVSSHVYGLGAKVYVAGRIRGIPVFTYLEITEFVPNRRIVSRSFPSIVGNPVWSFEPKGTGTVVTFSSDFRLPFPVVGRFLRGIVLEDEVRWHVEESLRRLKRLIESRRQAAKSSEPEAGRSGG